MKVLTVHGSCLIFSCDHNTIHFSCLFRSQSPLEIAIDMHAVGMVQALVRHGARMSNSGMCGLVTYIHIHTRAPEGQ